MKAQWQAWSAKFAAISKREKTIIAAAAVIVVVLGGDALWMTPQWNKAKGIEKAIVAQRGEGAKMTAELAGLSSRVQDPDAGNRATLAEMRQQLADSDAKLKGYGVVLVPPEKMTQLLQSLLTRHRGLELVSLKTLPPTPLVERPAPPKVEGAAAPAAPPMLASAGGQLYKHGIEISIAGGYPELMAYLAELEASPQRLMWGQMTLRTTRYPRSELVLVLYSLSLDKTWLIV